MSKYHVVFAHNSCMLQFVSFSCKEYVVHIFLKRMSIVNRVFFASQFSMEDLFVAMHLALFMLLGTMRKLQKELSSYCVYN